MTNVLALGIGLLYFGRPFTQANMTLSVRIRPLATAFASLVGLGLLAQNISNPDAGGQLLINIDRTVPVEFLGTVQPFVHWDSTQVFENAVVRDANGLVVKGNPPGTKEARLHAHVDPTARPLGEDPALQTAAPLHGFERAVDISVNGIGNTGVNPPDPCLAVGPNHVIQMINGGSGAYFRICNKSLATVGAAQTYMDNFLSSIISYSGLGDPVVLYDALADRWLMTEFASGNNNLYVAVSQTADPTGAWYAYSYTATNFPDYPKYGVWNNCYVVTSNENSPAIYALPRANMLAGTAGTAVRFTVPAYATIGFQACTPVHFDGGDAPPAGAPAMFMRMADDAWTTITTDVDRLEIWTINYNAATPASSTISGPTTMNTEAFDTGLCGYTAFACMNQPGTTTTLDPLREVLMNRVCYRNLSSAFGYEAIVCSHVTDVGSDRGGVRWYELHRTGGSANPWSIYQQGTWSPDANDRWMSGIAINQNGDIGLMYNISGATGGNVYPSVRYTGRYRTDPLGQMTMAETSIVAGAASNTSNRYGDYGSLNVDPADGLSFYGTAQYNPTGGWSTRMFKFSFPPLTTPDVKVSPKVFLSGPYDIATGLMSDALRSAGILPATEPYTGLGYVFTGLPGAGGTLGSGVLSVTGNNAIVDWVIVELRNSSSPSTVLASCAALLQRDGDVVALDGTSPVSLTTPSAAYFVAVRHRNHLGVMTGAALALSSTTTTIDLTSAATSTYGTEARSMVGSVMAMWTGDVTFNRQLGYTGVGNDRDPILVRVGSTTPNSTVAGYYTEDTNMDGTVIYVGSGNDRDAILVNVGSTTPNNIRSEQIP